MICLMVLSLALFTSNVQGEELSGLKLTGRRTSTKPPYNYHKNGALKTDCRVTVALTVCDSGHDYEKTGHLNNEFKRGTQEGSLRQIEQTLVLLKSILITSKFSKTLEHKSSCVEVIIFSETRKYIDDVEEQIFVREKWDASFTHFLKLTFVPAKYPAGTEWMRNLYLPCTTLRLFFPDILVNYDSIIYLDTDIILLRSIQELWNEFLYFSNSTLTGIAPGSTKNKVNAGVILMNLTRMREAHFTQEMPKIAQKHSHELFLADQTILNIYFDARPAALHYLPCYWNYATVVCQEDLYCKDPRLKSDGIGALHGKGQAFSRKSSAPYFRRMFRIFQQAQLNENFSLKHFVQRVSSGLNKVTARNGQPKTFCESYLAAMMRGLEQLFKDNEIKIEPERVNDEFCNAANAHG